MKKIILFILLPLTLFAQPGWEDINYKADFNDSVRFNGAVEGITVDLDTLQYYVTIIKLDDTLVFYATPQDIADSIQAHEQNFGSVIWNETPIIQDALRELYWDAGNHTLTLNLDVVDVKLQIGQELLTYVRNRSGSTIADGRFVRFTGSTGQVGEITLAGCSSTDSLDVAGMTTHEIPDNNFGFIATHGNVRGLTTNNLTEGSKFYLGYAGVPVDTMPMYPLFAVKGGLVVYSQNNNGILQLRISRDYENHEPGSALFINVNGEIASDPDYQFYNDTLSVPYISSTELFKNNIRVIDSVEFNDSLQALEARFPSGGGTITRTFNDTIKFDYTISKYGQVDIIEDLTIIADTVNNEDGNGALVVFKANGFNANFSNFYDDSKYPFDTTTNMLNYTMFMIQGGEPGYNIYRQVLFDTIAPALQTLQILPDAPNRIIATYNEALYGTPTISDFAITGNSGAADTAITIAGSTVLIDCDQIFLSSDTVVVEYSGTSITDSKSNISPTFTDTAENLLAGAFYETQTGWVHYYNTIESDITVNGSNQVLTWTDLMGGQPLEDNVGSYATYVAATDTFITFNNSYLKWFTNVPVKVDTFTFTFVMDLTANVTRALLYPLSGTTMFSTSTSSQVYINMGGGTLTFNSVFNFNNRVELTIVADGVNWNVYANGVLKGSQAINGIDQEARLVLYLAVGKLYAFGFRDHESSASEVQEMYDYHVNLFGW